MTEQMVLCSSSRGRQKRWCLRACVAGATLCSVRGYSLVAAPSSVFVGQSTSAVHAHSRAAEALAAAAPTHYSGSVRRQQPRMMWSGGRRTRPDEVTVNIERPSMNSRRISGSIIVDKPIEDVWLVLTDYNKLSDYVPNLTQSKQIAHPDGGIRLFQEGAQKIVGLDFRASLTMDMEEHYADPDDKMAMRKIKFKLVDSGMFTEFSGEWR
jgi:Polyketide cyclase / dehydrase and lipid transport